MRLHAVVVDLEMRDCGERLVDDVLYGGMHHDGQRRPLESSSLDEVDLAASGLFSRRALHPHPDAEVGGKRSQRNAGAGSGGGNDVVAAGVTHFR